MKPARAAQIFRAGLSYARRRVRDDWRSFKEHGWATHRALTEAWKTPEYQEVFDKPEPLVSICVATYNRADLLLDRCVASLLAQTYADIEIVVVGDACTDDTAERMAKLGDPRVVFENLARRGDYPDNPAARYNIAGLDPANRAYELARGDFITRLDDDDSHAPDRVEKLVRFAQEKRAEMVYHPFHHQMPDDSWKLNQAPIYDMGSVTTGSLFFHRWLMNVPYQPDSILRYGEPGDWNFARQCRFVGATLARYPEPLLTHYKERNQAAPE